MLRAFFFGLALFGVRANAERKETASLAARSPIENRVAEGLHECLQAHAAAAKKLKSQKQQCDDGADKLRAAALKAGKTLDELRMEINAAAGNAAALKKAAAKAERDVALWRRRLRAVTQAHELNQTRHEVDEAHTDARYTAMLKNLTSSIEAASRARDNNAASVSNMFKERAGKWDAMQDAMIARDDGNKKFQDFTARCEKKMLLLTSAANSLAEDVKAMQNVSQLLKHDGSASKPTDVQSALLEMHRIIAEKRKSSKNLIWASLASAIESNITLV